MAENKSRYVLVCQQAFAFATVAAVGLSAAGVVELKIVAPGDASASTVAAPRARGGHRDGVVGPGDVARPHGPAGRRRERGHAPPAAPGQAGRQRPQVGRRGEGTAPS